MQGRGSLVDAYPATPFTPPSHGLVPWLAPAPLTPGPPLPPAAGTVGADRHGQEVAVANHRQVDERGARRHASETQEVPAARKPLS